ncbi:hypothetical protein Acsp06_18690 [Actinomycetospora sp. NBRC 106375]|nr:hypothetical protein Acsp06_18690 [Actinomycetospora sp. NBRC 106375]
MSDWTMSGPLPGWLNLSTSGRVDGWSKSLSPVRSLHRRAEREHRSGSAAAVPLIPRGTADTVGPLDPAHEE